MKVDPQGLLRGLEMQQKTHGPKDAGRYEQPMMPRKVHT